MIFQIAKIMIKDLNILRGLVKRQLSYVFTDLDKMERVYYLIIDDVITDVEECADENWNNSDVSIAIQRVLMDKFNWN